jgi:hypothetical protein
VRRNGPRPFAQQERIAQGAESLARRRSRAGRVEHVGEQHRELVAAEARDQILRAQPVGEAQAHHFEKAVSDRKTVGLVDRVEAADIDDQQRERG